MLPAARLLRRTGPGRRRDVATLKAELDAARGLSWGAEVRAQSRVVAGFRDELASLVGAGGNACAGCAAGQSLPEGAYSGGQCCAGPTADVFQPVEIVLLAARGIRPRDFGTPPREPDAGCAFRGSTGCSLPLRVRPTICVHYICRELMAELAQSGRAPRIGELQSQLANAVQTLAKLSDRHRADTEFEHTFAEPLAAAD